MESILLESFITHRGRVALLDWTDVNTDLIIPARYLKKIERTGFGPLLFADKRYALGGAPEAERPNEQRPRSWPSFRSTTEQSKEPPYWWWGTTSDAARAASTRCGR